MGRVPSRFFSTPRPDAGCGCALPWARAAAAMIPHCFEIRSAGSLVRTPLARVRPVKLHARAVLAPGHYSLIVRDSNAGRRYCCTLRGPLKTPGPATARGYFSREARKALSLDKSDFPTAPGSVRPNLDYDVHPSRVHVPENTKSFFCALIRLAAAPGDAALNSRHFQ